MSRKIVFFTKEQTKDLQAILKFSAQERKEAVTRFEKEWGRDRRSIMSLLYRLRNNKHKGKRKIEKPVVEKGKPGRKPTVKANVSLLSAIELEITDLVIRVVNGKTFISFKPVAS